MFSTSSRRPRLGALLVAGVLAVAGCSNADPSEKAAAPASGSKAAPATSSHHNAKPVKPKPLRDGETRKTIKMAESYTPSPPYGTGTDDYRCFLLDPGLEEDTWLTGTHVAPGNTDVVHHVILFQVPPEQVKAARAKDREDADPGWTCFGGTGLDEFQNVNRAAWIGAWAPGGDESVTKPGFGVRLAKGSRIVMQVHYNLLAGAAPDVSAAQLRLAPGARDYNELSTMLLPAPVELACRPEHSDGPLCSREAAKADLFERFGEEARTADMLYFLCGGGPRADEWQSCTRTLNEPITIHSVAAHMHLLGRQLKIETNPGTPRAKTVLDIPIWNFDDQGGIPIDPVRLKVGDEVKVSCQHVQWLRDELPAFEGQPDKYVMWGDGTTDEMCLGMLQVTRP